MPEGLCVFFCLFLLVHAEFGIGEIWFLTCIKQTKNIYLYGKCWALNKQKTSICTVGVGPPNCSQHHNC